MDVNKIHRGIVKFVSGKRVSFRALEDDGFKAITEDLFDAVGMTINRAVVKSHITYQ